MITWTNERRKLRDLIPWEHNPRQINKREAERLGDSLAEFGQIQTIAIGPDNEVYDGHQRKAVWSLLPQFGPDHEVDVRVSSRPLTEKERQKLVIYIHRGTNANWDWDELANTFEVPDLLEWGFDESELQLDWGNDATPDPGAQVDKAAELQEKWQVQRGQIWQVGRHRLIVGDCTLSETQGRLMRGERAQLGVTSPPYAVGKEYEAGVSFAEHLALLRSVADRALEVIEVGGFWFVNFDEIAAQSHTKPLTGSDRQCLYPISRDYWEICHVERGMDLYAMRIWYKPFNRLQQPFWSYKTSIPHYQEWEHIWTWRLPEGAADKCHDWDISSRAVWDTRKEATDDKPLTRHVAAFPVCLPERAIKAHSNEGDLVWEPFSGSGTTIAACERVGRICRASEIEPKYVAVTLERLTGMGLEAHLVS